MRAYGNGFTIVAASRGVDLPDPAQRLRIPAPRRPHPDPRPWTGAPRQAPTAEADIEADVVEAAPIARTRRRTPTAKPQPCKACGVPVTAAHIARTGRALHGCCTPPASPATETKPKSEPAAAPASQRQVPAWRE